MNREPTVVGYRYGPALIDVACDDADTARWLGEFLTPWFETRASGAAEATVRLSCSDSAYAALERRRTESTCRPVACFGLDTDVISLPAWTEPDGSTVIAEPGRSSFYRVHGNDVEMVARRGVPRVRAGLARVVREIATARMLAQPSVYDVHAAAIAVAGRAVLLVGAKRVGKTTLLAHAVASGRASLLANDRVLVDASRDPALALGVPTFVSVRDGTLQRFPDLRRHESERPSLLHSAELESCDHATYDDGVPVFALTPTQLAQRLGAATSRSAPIAAIVFPEICPDVDSLSLDRIDPAEGAARLRQCQYGARSIPSPTVFAEIAGGGAHEDTALADRLAAELPLFRCRLGADAYRDGADTWLRALPLEPANGARVA